MMNLLKNKWFWIILVGVVVYSAYMRGYLTVPKKVDPSASGEDTTAIVVPFDGQQSDNVSNDTSK